MKVMIFTTDIWDDRQSDINTFLATDIEIVKICQSSTKGATIISIFYKEKS